jgi:glutamyl/glutaminyl-tRNA synthetase
MMVSRFAPTPSGYLHAGNALNFILTWTLVRAHHGTLHLRIDDLDAARTKPEYIAHIFRVLTWLGLDWDEGPCDVASFERTFALKHRMARYEAFKQSILSHPLVYACECSRKEILQHNPSGRYPFTCKDKNLSFVPRKHALRLHIEESSSANAKSVASTMGDFVIWRKENLPAYQLASLVDDWRMGTTLLVRGEDLLPSTKAQRYLAEQFGLDAFLKVDSYHHALLTTSNAQKLSKSQRASPLDLSVSPKPLFEIASQTLGVANCANAHTLLHAYSQGISESSAGAIFELGGEK